MSNRHLAAAVLAAALVSPGMTAIAAPYTAEYVFGDSLSDNGNLAEAYYHQNLPNPPSFQNSFTNGPVAVSVLAGALGVSLRPSLWATAFQDPFHLYGSGSYVPGTNYAVAGATSAAQASGGAVGINLPQQVAAFGAATALKADPNALYVVMIGGNDVRNAALSGTGASAVGAGVQSELQAIQMLAGEGARNLLVVNVPNVGVIPEFAQDNPTLAAAATAYSQLYDQTLSAGLAGVIAASGINLAYFDLYNYNAAILANAASYGLTNTTDRCYVATPLSSASSASCGVNASNIGSFVYWDSIHPTARVQALWASGMEAALGVAVPEPATATLVAASLAGLLARRRRAS